MDKISKKDIEDISRKESSELNKMMDSTFKAIQYKFREEERGKIKPYPGRNNKTIKMEKREPKKLDGVPFEVKGTRVLLTETDLTFKSTIVKSSIHLLNDNPNSVDSDKFEYPIYEVVGYGDNTTDVELGDLVFGVFTQSYAIYENKYGNFGALVVGQESQIVGYPDKKELVKRKYPTK